MFRRSSGFRAALGIVFVIFLSTSLFADTIRLKDGSLIKGTIVSFADGRFVVVIGDGARRRELSLAADEIASIEFDPQSTFGNRSASNGQSGAILPVSTKTPPQGASLSPKPTWSSMPMVHSLTIVAWEAASVRRSAPQ